MEEDLTASPLTPARLCLNCVDESASHGDLSSPFQRPLHATAAPSSLLVTLDHCGGGAGRAPPQEATVRASEASTPLSSGKVASGVREQVHEPPGQYSRQVRTGVHFQVEELAYHS